MKKRMILICGIALVYAGAGLDAKGIVAKVLATLGRGSDARKSMIA
jgi:1-deoxy-D-xylulose-5-phosphate synthase